MLEPYRSERIPSLINAKMIPDVWFEPYVILEVTGAEISISPIHTASMGHIKEGAGLGIRFPRFTGRVRDDKDATECTTYSEITQIYLLQEENPDGT